MPRQGGRGTSVVGVAAAPLRFEQHALDDAGVDIMGSQVFDGCHGVAGFLDGNTVIHDIAALQVEPFIVWLGKRQACTVRAKAPAEQRG